MKHPNDNIDQIFRQNLTKAEVKLPNQEAFWKRIDPNKPKRRRPILFWMALGLVGLMSGLWIVNSNSKINGVTEKNTTIVESQPLVSTELLSTSDSKINVATEKDVTLAESQPFASADLFPTSDSKTNVGTENNTAIVESQPLVSTKLLPTSNSSPSSSHTSASTLSKQSLGHLKEVNQQSRNTTKTNANKTQQTLRLSTPVSTTVAEKTMEISSRRNKYLSSIHQLVTLTPVGIAHLRTPPLIAPSLLPFTPKLSKTIDERSSWYWQMQIEAGKLTDNQRQHITPLASYQTQIAIGRKLTDNSRFSVGLEYQHVEKQHEISAEVESVEKVWYENAYIRNGEFIGDSIFVAIIQNKVTRSPVRETLINLPLGYYHDVLQKDKITVGLKAGLIMNLSRLLTGPKLNGRGQWEDVTRQRQTRIGLCYELGVEAVYELSSKSQFYITPKVRFSPHDRLDGEKPFFQRKRMIAVELGYRSGF